MHRDNDSTSFWTSVATAAPIFALLVVLRISAPPHEVLAPPSDDLVVNVYDTGWALGLRRSAGPGELGPSATWVPQSLGRDGVLLRRAARDLSGSDGAIEVRVVATASARSSDLVWTRRALAGVGPVTVDPGRLASVDGSRHKKNGRSGH